MAIKSQIRLVQLTGSVVDYKPAAVAAGVTAAAFSAGDLSGSFRYMAQAIANIHGNVEYGAQTPGLIGAADGANYNIVLDQNDAGQKIHLDSEGAVDIDAVTGIAIDSVGAAANFTVASDGNGEDLTLSVTGATDSSVVIASSGTGADAISAKASAGDIIIEAEKNDKKVTIKGDHESGTAIHLDGNAATASVVLIDAGKLDVDASAEVEIQGTADSFLKSSAGDVTIEAEANNKKLILKGDHESGTAVHIDANANANSVLLMEAGALDIDVTAAANIDSVGFDLNAGSGTIEFTTSGDADMNFNALALDLTDSSAITITSSEAAEDLVIQQVGGNDSSIIIAAAGTGTDAIKLGASAGGVDVDAAGAFDLQAGTMSLDATGASNLTVTAGADAADLTISMGNDGTPRNSSIILDSAGTGVDAIKLNASAGGIEVNVIDGKSVSIGKAGGVELMLSPSSVAAQEIALLENSGGTKRDAVKLAAAAGGLVMSASSAVDLSGSVCFSADAQMDPLNGGSMPFAKLSEFSTFRGKSLFDRTTTVIGAMNALADSVASSEPTLFALTLTADINAGSDVTVAKVAGDATNLLKTVGENKARVYVNGQLMKSSSGGVTNDYVIQDSNDLRFQFQLKAGDVVQVMDFS
tara:strand:+ start:1200 stop:3122 length:1923 start_codon:yes stop_codon:yes gene_type:complete